MENNEERKVIKVRYFKEDDYEEIQELYKNEGWNTIIKRPEDGLKAFKNSNASLVATLDEKIVGVLRGFTDTQITTYIIELLVHEEHRGRGIGANLINECHRLFPNTRIEVMATEFSKKFYSKEGFRKMKGFRKSFI